MPQEYQHALPEKNPLSGMGAKALLLYLLPAPLLIKLIISIVSVSGVKILMTAGALFCLYNAAHVTRLTLVRLSKAKRRPTPLSKPTRAINDRRQWAALQTALGVAIVMLMLKKGIAITLLMPACAYIGYVLFYGLPKKVTTAHDTLEHMPKATREAITEAYRDLESIELLRDELQQQDPALTLMVDKVLNQSYAIMDLLVKAPEDAGRARRFLNVYINRIKEILQQYITLKRHGKTEDIGDNVLATLTEVEQAFRTKQSELLDDDIFTLGIQLEVLDEQIKHEQ